MTTTQPPVTSLTRLQSLGYRVTANKYRGVCSCGASVAAGEGRLLSHPNVPRTHWLLCKNNRNACSRSFGRSESVGDGVDERIETTTR